MGFIDIIFRKIKPQPNIEKREFDSNQSTSKDENVLKLLEVKKLIEFLLGSKKYLAKSEYQEQIKEYVSVINFFDVLKKSSMLNDFCTRNGISVSEIEYVMGSFANIENLVEEHNEKYISETMILEKDYLDNILKAVDPVVSLDEDQRRVVLTDEDYCLVIAGAGAGKTTTVAAKVKYLVDKQGIKPSQILVVSFTNKAVNELKEKIQGALGIRWCRLFGLRC